VVVLGVVEGPASTISVVIVAVAGGAQAGLVGGAAGERHRELRIVVA
jgi:hypothetical protein